MTATMKDQASRKVFVIALTGGIGSGKTTVANMFAKLGVPIIDADVIAHTLTNPDGTAYHIIINHFGNDIVNTNKMINRKKLRDIIFNNVDEKKWLENVLHPLIRQTMQQEINNTRAPYCICVIPLLAKSKGIDFIDRVLVIDAPVDLQRARVKARDRTTTDQIQKIMNAQANRHARIAMADDVLTNDGDLASLKKKVSKLHQLYCELSHSYFRLE